LRKGRNDIANHWSEHGLGHLLNPTDLLSDDREWIAHVWESIIAGAHGRSRERIAFSNLTAVGHLSITSPGMHAPMAELNTKKKYPDQIKPFNFLLTSHVNSLGHPIGVQPDHFHLIAPFESNSGKWAIMSWIDQYSGKRMQPSIAEPRLLPRQLHQLLAQHRVAIRPRLIAVTRSIHTQQLAGCALALAELRRVRLRTGMDESHVRAATRQRGCVWRITSNTDVSRHAAADLPTFRPDFEGEAFFASEGTPAGTTRKL
jgi:hypothetical protein